jgi:hypothetical protein
MPSIELKFALGLLKSQTLASFEYSDAERIRPIK